MMDNLCLLHNKEYDRFCPECGIHTITANIPTEFVQIGGYFVGREKAIGGKYYHNRLWVENGVGEGCFIPLPKVETLIAKEFQKHF